MLPNMVKLLQICSMLSFEPFIPHDPVSLTCHVLWIVRELIDLKDILWSKGPYILKYTSPHTHIFYDF